VERVESAIAAVRDAGKGDNLEAIRTSSADLQKASYSIAEQLYKQQGQGTGSSQPHGPHAGGHEDVVEGEVVDA